MSEKKGKKNKGKENGSEQFFSSRSITQIVCFAIVATVAVFAFVQARRALYGENASSVISGDKFALGKEEKDGYSSGDSIGDDMRNILDITTTGPSEDNQSTSSQHDSSDQDTRGPERTTANTTKVFSDTTMVLITASPVNIRSGAGKDFKTIARTERGKTFRLLSSEASSDGKKWLQIAISEKKKGWILSTCCRIVDESEIDSITTKQSRTSTTTTKNLTVAEGEGVTIKATPANIRSGAGGKYKTIARAKKGDFFRLITKKKDANGTVWYEISLDGGKTGWIKSSLCYLTNESETTSAPSKTTSKNSTYKSTVTTAKSTTTDSTTTNSTTAKSTTAKSTTAKSTTAKSTTVKSTTAKSTTVKSTTTKSTTAKSSTDDSATSSTSETSASSTTTKATDSLLMSIQPSSHSAKYFIVVYKGSQSVVVYGKDDNNHYTKQVKTFTCSTGKKSSPTRIGKYRIRAKYRWRWLVGNVYGQYNSSIGNDYLFHSVPYEKKDASTLENEEYDKLGSPASKGCIRMCVRDTKWIYDNCAVGTDVRIVDESGPAGPGVPKRKTAEKYSGWDPSDKWTSDNPYFS